MPDVITALGIATASFQVLKKGFSMAKDIESMHSDLARWMGACSDVRQAHNKKKKRRFRTVEEEALETWAAMEKVRKQEEAIRLHVIANCGGEYAWQQVIRLQAKIRKQRMEEERARQKQREEMTVWASIILLISAAFIVAVIFLSRIFP